MWKKMCSSREKLISHCNTLMPCYNELTIRIYSIGRMAKVVVGHKLFVSELNSWNAFNLMTTPSHNAMTLYFLFSRTCDLINIIGKLTKICPQSKCFGK